MTNTEQTTKLRMLYLAKILYEETDSDHFYTTNQLRKLLLDRYGIDSHRQTIPTDIAALRALGVDIKEYLGTQKRYWIENRKFEVPEVKLLIDAVNSAKFIPKKKSGELEAKLQTLVSNYEAEGLTRNVSVEHRVKRDTEGKASLPEANANTDKSAYLMIRQNALFHHAAKEPALLYVRNALNTVIAMNRRFV